MNRKAFTIVEILIVIAIVALLAAIAIPSIKQSNSKPLAGNALYKAEKVDTLPAVTGYVNDTIGLLAAADKDYIVSLCTTMEPKAQIAVCIVSSTDNLSIEDYSILLAEKWQVGHKGKDDGVILVIAKNDRKLRIEVGRGLEEKLTDSKAKAIIDDIIVPAFKSGQFSSGTRAGVIAIAKEIDK